MPKLIIQRPNEFINRFREYVIYIDGKNIGSIANGKIKEFDVTSGSHSLVAKIDWCSSPEINFEITDTKAKIFSVGGFTSAVPLFLSLLYYLTIGRKKYLTLKEV